MSILGVLSFMSEKNIVHFAPAFTSKGGGIFEVVNCLVFEQCKAYGKTNVSVIGCSDQALREQENLPHEVVLRILPYKFSYIKFSRHFFKYIKTMKECDILHIHGAWSLQFIYLLPFILFFHKYHIVYQPHGLLSRTGFNRRKIVKTLLWYLMMNYIIRKSSIVISTSLAEEQEFIHFKEFAHKTERIPNAIATEFFDKTPKLRSNNNFLFLSQIIPVKGLEELLKAFARIIQKGHDVHLTIGGYGEASYIRELKALIDELKVNNHVTFVGKIDRDQRVAVYDAHKFFILPSKHESFGLVVGEALARGCVSFISKRTPWVSTNNIQTLLKVEPEENDLYTKILDYLETSGQYELASLINAQESIHQEYSWTERLTQFNRVYFE